MTTPDPITPGDPRCAQSDDAYDEDIDLRTRLWLLWRNALAWLHRCPECGRRPDGHEDWMPRWEDDKTARMLGIGQYGCRRCGHGSVEERDRTEQP